ncbi:bifunctional tetrahydrofolate synthase/dihydrofolate synthase [Marinobacterium aestuariivivens]|uniref:Dihydrofolate synthase/folylpolyglutamate synthase n=1 Tax=Marinobacterium aestuariivivens TaxID=1698799 RepID=A0ABW2A7N2_9GAMM
MQAVTELTLNEWLSRIEACHPSEIELGLDRIRDVARQLALDFGATRVVTIAGTNGKGSTQTFLDRILRHGGHSTGCYSSPHFLRYNERVRLNGEEVSDGLLCDAFAAVERARGTTPLTYFEFGTLAALKIFADARPEYLLLEVGLGGRLDAVNIIDADVAVVTTVALDHTDWLGDSRELIGREKAGIFRAGRAAVCGDPQPPVTVAEVATQLGACLHQVGQTFSWQSGDSSWDWQGLNARGEAVEMSGLPLPALPLPNAATALQVLHLLPDPVPRQAIERGLQDARMTGRMQRISLDGSDCILDVAHNPEAAGYIAARLRAMPVRGRRHLLLGMLGDKDVAGVLAALAPLADRWHLAGLAGARGQSSDRLAETLDRVDDSASRALYPDVASALQGLRGELTADDQVLIAGSFFTVSEALAQLKLEG